MLIFEGNVDLCVCFMSGFCAVEALLRNYSSGCQLNVVASRLLQSILHYVANNFCQIICLLRGLKYIKH